MKSPARHATGGCRRQPVQCIVPPYMVEAMAHCTDPAIREGALVALAHCAAVRAVREFTARMPTMMVVPSPAGRKHRLVYDARGKDLLPGKLVRKEGEPRAADSAINEAYEFSGDTFNFFHTLFGRNSLDDAGMSLISSVHVDEAGGRDHEPG